MQPTPTRAAKAVECPVCREKLRSLQGIFHHVNGKRGHAIDWRPEVTDPHERFRLFSETFPWLWAESARYSTRPPHERTASGTMAAVRAPIVPPLDAPRADEPGVACVTCPTCQGSGKVYLRPAPR